MVHGSGTLDITVPGIHGRGIGGSAILELWGVWFRMIRAADSATEQTRLLQKLDEDFQELEDQGLISGKAL